MGDVCSRQGSLPRVLLGELSTHPYCAYILAFIIAAQRLEMWCTVHALHPFVQASGTLGILQSRYFE